MTKYFKRGKQVHDTQRDFHRTAPIWTAIVRILLDPASQLCEKLRGVALIFRRGVSTRERHEVAQAIQFPEHTYVRTISAQQFDIAVVFKRPNVIRERISRPLNLPAEA